MTLALSLLLQLNDQMLGFALLGAGLGSLLTMWISGWLMARYSSRTIAHLSGILFPVSLMGPALATGFWSLAIGLVLLGGANGLMDIAMNSQAASYERLIGRPVMSSFHAGWSLSCWCGSLCGSLFLAEPGRLIFHLPLCQVGPYIDLPLHQLAKRDLSIPDDRSITVAVV
jgi:predicted MFS family arabinose efflux permease